MPEPRRTRRKFYSAPSPATQAKAAQARRDSKRRHGVDPSTCDRIYSDDETEFMKAIDRYKRDFRRPFPTCSEVLEVLRSLGYRRVAEAEDLPRAKS